jgi:catechol 2,3-dioxygenase-like lactoylglutathione lyase family enzyme
MARGHIEQISAVTLQSTNMKAAVAFYKALGLQPLYGGAEAEFTSFKVGSGFLNIQLVSGRRSKTVWGRIIFYVDDVNAMFERVTRAGYYPETEPEDALWGERYFHVRDPDGHELSFARPIAEPTSRPLDQQGHQDT